MSAKKPKTPKATEQEKALAERGANEFNDFVTRGVPIARKFSDLITNPRHAARLAGQANAEVAQAFAGEDAEGFQTALASGGVPGSGSTVTALTLPSVKQASASGLATGRSVQAAKDRELTGLRKAAAFGRGVADTSSVGLRSAADTRTQESIVEANARTARYVSNIGAINDVVKSAGGTAIGDYSYGKELAKFAADNPNLKITRPGGLFSGWGFDRAARR